MKTVLWIAALVMTFTAVAAQSSPEDSSLSMLYRAALAEGADKKAETELRDAVAELCGNTNTPYSVQLWALSNYLYAEQKKSLPIPVRIIPVLRKGRVLYRVASGCFTSREDAAIVRDVLEGELAEDAHVLDLGKAETARREMAELVKSAKREQLLVYALSTEQMEALLRLYEQGVEREFIWNLLNARPEARALVLEIAVRFSLAAGDKVTPQKREIGFFLEKSETDAALYYLEELARLYPLEVYRAAHGIRKRLRQKTYHAILLRCKVAQAFAQLYDACLEDARASYFKPLVDGKGLNRALHFQLGLDLAYKRRDEFREALIRDLENKDMAVRLYCGEYLGRMGDKRGRGLIRAALDTEEARLAAIRALGETGGVGDLDSLRRLLGDKYSAEIRTAAKGAIRKIEGR